MNTRDDLPSLSDNYFSKDCSLDDFAFENQGIMEEGNSFAFLEERSNEGEDFLSFSLSSPRLGDEEVPTREEESDLLSQIADEIDARAHYGEADRFFASEETKFPSDNSDDNFDEFYKDQMNPCRSSLDFLCPLDEAERHHHYHDNDCRSACSPSESNFSSFSENLSTVGHGEATSHCEDDYAESEDKDYSESMIEECLEELKSDLNNQVDEIIQRGPGLNRSEIAEKIPGKNPGTYKWRCRDCLREYDHRTSVFKHHDADHKKIRHHCADCDSHYSSSQGLKKHCGKTGHRPVARPNRAGIKKSIKKDGRKDRSQKKE